MEVKEIIKKIEETKNQPALMVDGLGNVKAIVVKIKDLEKSDNIITEDGKIDYYEFDNVSIAFQAFPEKERDKAARKRIAVRDIFAFYSAKEIFSLIKDISMQQQKNIEEDEFVAKTVNSNYTAITIYVPNKLIGSKSAQNG